MEWIEYFKPLLTSPSGQFLLGVLVLTLGPTALFSRKTAEEKFGVFGALSRWWARRKEDAVKKASETHNRQIAELKAEIARVDNDRKNDRESLQSQISQLRENEESQHRYIVWVTAWFRRLEIWSAERGLELPVPRFRTYPEWKRLEDDSDLDLH